MDNLPNEVIQNILKQLPQKDLLNCTTVCKLFREIIDSYKMIKQIVIHENCDSSSNFLTRKYSKMIIKDNNEANILKAIKCTGHSILEVKFELHSTSINSIASIINHFPNIQKIVFYYVRLDDDEEVVKDVVLPTPQNVILHLLESDPKIFNIFANLSVSELKIAMYGDSPYYDFTNFLPFMQKQKELKSFSLSGIYESNLMYGNLPKGDYHLKEFSMSNSDLEEWIYLDTYLNDHIGTLEKLSFQALPSYDATNIIKSCSCLKSLKLTEMTTIELDSDIKTVEELSVDYPCQALSKFVNVKKLYIQNASSEVNRIISGGNVIEVSVRYGTVEEIHCEKAKKMTLTNIDGPLTEEFFRTHSNVEDLKLENHFLLDDRLLEVILSNIKDLKVLTIYGINNLSANAFGIIKNHCKNLRVLDTKTWSQHYSIDDWKCLFDINGIEIYTENFHF